MLCVREMLGVASARTINRDLHHISELSEGTGESENHRQRRGRRDIIERKLTG